MITITESASKALLQSLKEEGKTTETHRLRVGVESGGCSGLQYFMEFFDKNENFEGDKVIETFTLIFSFFNFGLIYYKYTEKM